MSLRDQKKNVSPVSILVLTFCFLHSLSNSPDPLKFMPWAPAIPPGCRHLQSFWSILPDSLMLCLAAHWLPLQPRSYKHLLGLHIHMADQATLASHSSHLFLHPTLAALSHVHSLHLVIIANYPTTKQKKSSITFCSLPSSSLQQVFIFTKTSNHGSDHIFTAHHPLTVFTPFRGHLVAVTQHLLPLPTLRLGSTLALTCN